MLGGKPIVVLHSLSLPCSWICCICFGNLQKKWKLSVWPPFCHPDCRKCNQFTLTVVGVIHPMICLVVVWDGLQILELNIESQAISICHIQTSLIVFHWSKNSITWHDFCYIHRKYKWLERVSNPPLLRVLFETFKIINLRKNSRQTSRETIEIDPSHFRVKWASSRQNSTQIVLFLSNFWALFFFWAKLELFIFTRFDYVPVFNPYFCMSQKSLRQICKVWNYIQLPIVYWISWFPSWFSYMKYTVPRKGIYEYNFH